MGPVLFTSLTVASVCLVYVGPNKVKAATSRTVSMPFSGTETAKISRNGLVVVSIFATLAVVRAPVDKGALTTSSPNTGKTGAGPLTMAER